jgi:hypothetical protein
MTQLPITTEAGEPRTGVVIPIFHPKADLGEYLAPKVALLKAIFGIDDNGQLTKPAPPKWFSQQVFEYIMFGEVCERRPRGSRKPTLAGMAKQARKAGLEVARLEAKPDGTKVIVIGEPELADADNPWPTTDLRKKK